MSQHDGRVAAVGRLYPDQGFGRAETSGVLGRDASPAAGSTGFDFNFTYSGHGERPTIPPRPSTTPDGSVVLPISGRVTTFLGSGQVGNGPNPIITYSFATPQTFQTSNGTPFQVAVLTSSSPGVVNQGTLSLHITAVPEPALSEPSSSSWAASVRGLAARSSATAAVAG